MVERAVVLSNSSEISSELFPKELFHAEEERPQKAKLATVKKMAQISFITNSLAKNNFNVAKTAKALGIHKTTLYRMIERFDIKLEKK